MSARFSDVEDIKAEIRRRGQTLTGLSKGLGFSGGALSRRFLLFQAWPVLDERLADFLGTTPKHLFPTHYTAAGKPKGIVRHQNVIRPFDPRLCPNLAKDLAA
jgi:lambda repressor-like predicted transcriptional regulator